ncbi:hypothetical protein OIO90_000623 [Microbotryomycetes sp. JL221]|nr:hypothetical protein OIO90_000623 [Microbotryomycetes sp. JL221]
MNNLGAGGLATPRTANAANASLFAIMTVTCVLGSAVTAKLGPKLALVLGTLGYAPYAAGLFCNSKFGTQWGLILGAILCGLSAGVFWATEGAIALAYPEPHRRARSLSIWLILNLLGSILGGAINLALNVDRGNTGSISVNTYAVFIAIQCLGPFIVYGLLSPPEKVQRDDGSKVVIRSTESFFGEIKETLKVWIRPPTLVLCVVFVQNQWAPAATGTYLATFFSVRARALSSLVVSLMAQVLFWILGWFLDSQRWTLRQRATWSFVVIFAWYAAGISWTFANTYNFTQRTPAPVYDWTTPGWAPAWVSFAMYNLPQQLLYNWLFWVVSFMTSKGEDHIRYVGVMRSAESAAQALSFGLSATKVELWKSMAVNVGLFVAALYPAWHTVQHISLRDEQGLNANSSGQGPVQDQSDPDSDSSIEKT